MKSNKYSDFQFLYRLERRLIKRVATWRKASSTRAQPKLRRRRTHSHTLWSPWLVVWLTVGTLLLSFQAFLWLHNTDLTWSSEITALVIGFGLALIGGVATTAFAPNNTTNWRLSGGLFILWMLLPSLFPLLFLIGLFLQVEPLITSQTSWWRIAVEFLFFGLGLALVARWYRQLKLTQGAITIIAISTIVMTKIILTNSFYLAGACPITTHDERLAYLSNSADEVRLLRLNQQQEQFYQSPFGQFVCTRTQENAWR